MLGAVLRDQAGGGLGVDGAGLAASGRSSRSPSAPEMPPPHGRKDEGEQGRKDEKGRRMGDPCQPECGGNATEPWAGQGQGLAAQARKLWVAPSIAPSPGLLPAP